MTKLVAKPVAKLGLLGTALVLCCLFGAGGANAADGCGAGFHLGLFGDCLPNRAPIVIPVPVGDGCGVGYIWRNGRCRQNIGNDPFVSTWPNAPRD